MKKRTVVPAQLRKGLFRIGALDNVDSCRMKSLETRGTCITRCLHSGSCCGTKKETVMVSEPLPPNTIEVTEAFNEHKHKRTAG